jgi:ABC-2 type transport system permease protein
MSPSWQKLKAIAKKEIWQLSRDRLTAILLISVPVAQILLFGFAIDLSPKLWPSAWVSVQSDAQMKVVDQDREIQSLIINQLNQTQFLSIPPSALSESDANLALQRGDIRFVLKIPSTPTNYLKHSQALPITLIFDGSDPYVNMTASMLSSRLQTDLTRIGISSENPSPQKTALIPTSNDHSSTQIQQPSEGGGVSTGGVSTGGVSTGGVSTSIKSAFLQPANSGAYLVPALVGVILTLTLTLMAAFSMVRERERGTWQSLMSAPVNASLIVFGKLAPYAAIGLLIYATLQILAHQLFATPWASVAQWFAVSCFILGQLGLGASLSLFTKTQMQAMQLGVFFYLPSILLSGFMFPFHAMPSWARAIGEFLPLTHFLRVQRADLFRQAKESILFELSLPILLFTVVTLSVAILGYRRQMK